MNSVLSLSESKNDLRELIDGKNILITGGTGSFGHKLVEILIADFSPKKIVIYSRDEFKQVNMKKRFPQTNVRFLIGDVRDYERTKTALTGIDFVFHAAALKVVPLIEYNPYEAVKTNVIGTQNVVNASIEKNVKRVIALSTDKACRPFNTYGVSKSLLEKLVVGGNLLSDENGTKFSVLRYGNVMGSRGSIIPFFQKQTLENKEMTITDERMTRFNITIIQAVNFALNALLIMHKGEIFIPKITSYNIIQLANVIGGTDIQKKIIGIREGEKLHEMMVSEEESLFTYDCGSFYFITPFSNDLFPTKKYIAHYKRFVPIRCNLDFSYVSNKNEYITDADLKNLIDNLDIV